MSKITQLFFSTLTLATIVFYSSMAQAEIGIPVQLKLKSPGGVYPTESGVNFKLYVLSPSSNCVLREEDFSTVNVVSGQVSLVLGAGVRTGSDPGLTLAQIYDNSRARSGLSCLDANNNIISTGQVYTPASTHQRIIRVVTTLSSENIIVNFNMRATPFAVQAESVGGKAAADIIVNDSATELNQTNLNDLLFDASRFNNLITLATTGQATSATSATTATNFTGSLGGDVGGTQSAVSVNRIRGVSVSATAPMNNQVLRYNGSEWVPSTSPTAPVTSVAGRSGDVTLSNTDISGLGTAAVLNAGTSANNLVQLDGSARIPVGLLPTSVLTTSSTLSGDVSGTVGATVVSQVGGSSAASVASAAIAVAAATSANVASAIVRRDGSGNVAATNLSSTNNSTQNIYLFEGTNTNSVRFRAPTTFSSYILTWPTDDGVNGQILQTDGSGNLSWGTPSTGTVTSVTASPPMSSSGGATPNLTISQASASSAGYLSSADFSTFNNKQNALGFTPLNAASNLSDLGSVSTARTNLGLGGAALLNVGTAAGTVAAGDDSRITGALAASAFNAYVASASCAANQTMYWNSVSSEFLCQSIPYPVTTVAGRSGDVTLSNTDISGLGNSATLNVGTVGGTVAAGDDSRIVNALQTTTVMSGDVSGTYNSLSVDRIKGRTVSSATPQVGQVLIYDGTNWVPTYGVPRHIRKTADQVFSSTTVSNDSTLAFNVSSGVTYRYRFHILYASAANTTGMRLALTYPAVTAASAVAQIPNGNDGTASQFQGTINASGDTVIATGTPAATTVHYATIQGVIVPSAAGTVQLRVGTEVNLSNITVRAGSFVEYNEVP